MQQKTAAVAQSAEFFGRDRYVVFAAGGGRAGDYAAGEDKARFGAQAFGGALDDAVLAGAARPDDQNERAAPPRLQGRIRV